MLKEKINLYLEKHGLGHFRPKAVLFDMDGVLYDSMPHHAIAWQESMSRFGINMTAQDAYATEGARGIDTIRHFVKLQKGEDISLAEAQTMYDVKTHIFHTMPEAPIFDGVLDVMELLAHHDITINVVTGSGQRPLIDRLLRDFGRFLSKEHIVTAYDVDRGKPYPDPYLMGLRKAGNLLPWEAMVVENAPLGVQSGAAADIFTIGVNSGPLPDQVLYDAGAHIVYQKMTELRVALNDLF